VQITNVLETMALPYQEDKRYFSVHHMARIAGVVSNVNAGVKVHHFDVAEGCP
jgi:hypothetical protein